MDQAEPTTALPDTPPTATVESAPMPLPDDASSSPPMAEVVPLELPPAEEPVAAAPAKVAERTIAVLVAPSAMRRLMECMVIFVITVLFLRAMAVEPFGVPTGSMAPTLLGNRKILNCPRCGYAICVGEPALDSDAEGPRPQTRYPTVSCPNCGQPGLNMNDGIELAGDRLLVDKNIYSVRRPRRWEPAVFRCPSDMTKPYVKRVAGLPGERILIQDGDVYVNGHIARKTLGECREERVLFFDINFPPKPDGWVNRWVLDRNLSTLGPTEPIPAAAFDIGDRDMHFDGRHGPSKPIWAAYRHHDLDSKTGLEKEEIIRDTFKYNGYVSEDRTLPVHDFSVEFEIEIISGSGQLLCRLFDGKDGVVASCPVGGSGEPSGKSDDVAPIAELKHEGMGIIRSAPRKPLRAGKKYKVEMAFVDRRVSFAVDGGEPFRAYDLQPALSRPEVVAPLALGVQGISATVRNVKIYRDVYYRSSGVNAVAEELVLGPKDYFMLGDNSGNSFDSRSWAIPGVPERNFLGKPFLLHQPSRISHLTILGRERTFQSIDWSRLRFLR